ncbi:MAG: HAMP domain-containing histidine kinase [Desulfuromonadales bacterium]|nr:HAMP domain-containing histidine kinase [Desulfuromonadales bacterium]
MKQLTDDELIAELKDRFAFNLKALVDLREMTAKLEVMNSRLQESEAVKGHFLSNIRNEINNPLTSIMGLSSQYFGGKFDPERYAEVSRMIYLEAFHLDFQLQNIFMAAELEAGEAEPAFSKVDIKTIVDRVVDAFNYQIKEKNISISVHMPDEFVFPTDARMLKLVLSNMLANAAEFCAEKGEIYISATVGANGMLLEIYDNGVGIDPVDQKTIFDRFMQLDNGTTKGHRGHGLGLSIVAALVELMGGSLTLESKIGHGCRIFIHLPETTTPVQDSAQGGNLFLFDDVEQF